MKKSNKSAALGRVNVTIHYDQRTQPYATYFQAPAYVSTQTQDVFNQDYKKDNKLFTSENISNFFKINKKYFVLGFWGAVALLVLVIILILLL